VIGHNGNVRPFDLIRWARQQVAGHDLRPLEGHVLLVLATYANADGIAWPSIRTLARDCGLTPTQAGSHSSVSRALARLEELGLVWTTQGGKGHPAKRELLFNPAAKPSPQADGMTDEPSPGADGNGRPPPGLAIPTQGCEPSPHRDGKYQRKEPTQQLKEQARGSHPHTGMASELANRMSVRRVLEASLASVDRLSSTEGAA